MSEPTLEWFLSLPKETQADIWESLQNTLLWSGRLCGGVTLSYRLDTDGSSGSLRGLFDSLHRAGADWEEYT